MIDIIMKKHRLPISMGKVISVPEDEAEKLVSSGRAVYKNHVARYLRREDVDADYDVFSEFLQDEYHVEADEEK